MANKVEVIIGTYDEYLLGYRVRKSPENGKETLIQSFADRSHHASVRCMAVSGKYLASGGADDRIFIYDMVTRSLVQTLLHHESTINTIVFTPDATHILSGANDGKMVAIRTNTWKIEAVWKKAHAGKAVTHISCHPSGKLALSLGNDLTLRTWNLIKGRLAYTTNLKTKVSLESMPGNIAWSPCGKYFTITGLRVIEIWKIETASMYKEQFCEAKPTTVCWATESHLLVGLENGKIMLLSIEVNEKPVFFSVDKQRVKAMAYVNEILATVSSSGALALWNINIEDKEIDQICSLNISCRPTCIALVDLTQFEDNYILKKEDEHKVEEIQRVGNDQKKRVESAETVIIEFEPDDDLPKLEIPTVTKAKEEQFETDKNDKNLSPRTKISKKVASVERKNRAATWVKVPVLKETRNESETSEDDANWTKCKIKESNNESVMPKLQKSLDFPEKNTNKKEVEMTKDENVITERAKGQMELEKSKENVKTKLNDTSSDLEHKEVSTKKVGKKKKAKKNVKQQANKGDLESISIVSSYNELGPPKLKRQIAPAEDMLQIDKLNIPTKKKKNIETPRKGPVLRVQKKKNF